MRCYLMRRGHIAAVEFLLSGSDDDLKDQAHKHFTRRRSEKFDGFEVWDGSRRLYCFPDDAEDGTANRQGPDPTPEPGR